MPHDLCKRRSQSLMLVKHAPGHATWLSMQSRHVHVPEAMRLHGMVDADLPTLLSQSPGRPPIASLSINVYI